MLKVFVKKILSLERREGILEALIRGSFLSLVSRFFGYIKNLFIAILLGFGPETDGFFMALSLIGLFLTFADVFDSIGIPQLVKASQENREKFIKIAGILLTFATILSFSFSFIAIISLPLLLKVISGFSLEALKSTELSFFFLLPYLFFSFYFRHFGAILRSQRRFTNYFIGEFIFSFSTFSFVVAGLLLKKEFIVLPLSVSISQMVATLYMALASRGVLHFRFFIDDTTKKMLIHFVQLSSLYGSFHIFTLVDKAFASHLETRSVSALTYGLMLTGIVRGVVRFEDIAMTPLSESGGSFEKLNFYAKKLLYVAVPSTIFLFVFSELVVKLFLGYGAFSNVDISLTSEALRYYALSLYFMFLWPLIYRVFQIREKLFTISIIAILGAAVNTVFNYLFVFVFKYGITGICVATFISYLFLCFYGYFSLKCGRV